MKLKKTNVSNLDSDMVNYARYKWSFLRRNEAYKNDYERNMTKLKKYNGYPKFDDNDILMPWCKRIIQDQFDFCYKWNISNLIDPKLSANDLLNRLYQNHLSGPGKELLEILNNETAEDTEKNEIQNDIIDSHIKWVLRSLFSYLYPFQYNSLPVRINSEHFSADQSCVFDPDFCLEGILVPTPKSDLGKDGILKLSLDLNYSKKTLLENLENQIDEWKETYNSAIDQYYIKKLIKEKLKLKESEIDSELKNIIAQEKSRRREKYTPQKNHWDLYELYIQVYDLKEEKKLSWAKIAKEMKLNSVQTARNYYKAAKRHIKNGIQPYVKL
jgi:hypothetical protein